MNSFTEKHPNGTPVVWVDANNNLRRGVLDDKQTYLTPTVTVRDEAGLLAHPEASRVAFDSSAVRDKAMETAKMVVGAIKLLHDVVDNMPVQQLKMTDGSYTDGPEAQAIYQTLARLEEAKFRMKRFVHLREEAIKEKVTE